MQPSPGNAPAANPPPAEEDIERLVTRIGADLQRLEDRLKLDGDRKCKVRFPRGFLRTADHFRKRWWFIRDDTLRRNLAYSLILSDVYRWLMNRTDLWGTAREMIIKEGVCLVGAVVESVTKDAMQKHCGKQTGFKKRTAKMAELGVITPALQGSLDALWDWRNREHLFMLDRWEYQEYTLAHYNGAIITLRQLREALEKWAITQDES